MTSHSGKICPHFSSLLDSLFLRVFQKLIEFLFQFLEFRIYSLHQNKNPAFALLLLYHNCDLIIVTTNFIQHSYFIAAATASTTPFSKTLGRIFPGLGSFTNDARFSAAFKNIFSSNCRTLLSSAPRKIPGKARTLFT